MAMIHPTQEIVNLDGNSAQHDRIERSLKHPGFQLTEGMQALSSDQPMLCQSKPLGKLQANAPKERSNAT
jgi:hypothetical protein